MELKQLLRKLIFERYLFLDGSFSPLLHRTTTVTTTFYQTPDATITGGTQTGYVAKTFPPSLQTYTATVPASTQTITSNGNTSELTCSYFDTQTSLD